MYQTIHDIACRFFTIVTMAVVLADKSLSDVPWVLSEVSFWLDRPALPSIMDRGVCDAGSVDGTLVRV
ncbi:hypothetical protein ACFXTH_009146 [Malus domestica]